VIVVTLLLWRLWSVWQQDEPTPDVVVFFFTEMLRGIVIDYL
jgi:hypothetical protein